MVDSFSLIPLTLYSTVQKSDTNNLSESEISSKGNPFSLYHCLKNKSTRSSVVIMVCVGIIQMSECSQSVIERIQLYPSSRGNGPIKSRTMLSYFETVSTILAQLISQKGCQKGKKEMAVR